MKCSRHVSPSWKNPAANGPWYQVESNPVIPVESLALTPPPKWMTAIAATTSATAVARRFPARLPLAGPSVPCAPSRREVSRTPACKCGCGRPPSGERRRDHQSAQPDNRHQHQIRHRLPGPERPQQLRAPDQQRGGDHRRRQAADDPAQLRHQPAPQPPRARAGAAEQQEDLGDPQQVATRARAPAPLAPPQHQTQDLVELGDPQQLRHRHVDDPADREAGAERDDLAAQPAPDALRRAGPRRPSSPRPAPPRRS